MKIKKLIAIILSALMFTGILPLNAIAGDDFEDLLRVINDPELTEFQYLVDGDRWDAVIR